MSLSVTFTILFSTFTNSESVLAVIFVAVVSTMAGTGIGSLSLTAVSPMAPAQLLGSTPKFVKAKGFEQIVDGIDLVAFDSILRIRCGKDRQGRTSQTFDEVHAIEVGHVDVAEDGIDDLPLQHLPCLYSAGAGRHETEVGDFADEGDELAKCQRLVFNS